MCPYKSNKHGCFFMFLPLNTIDTSFKTCTLKLITLKSNFYFKFIFTIYINQYFVMTQY